MRTNRQGVEIEFATQAQMPEGAGHFRRAGFHARHPPAVIAAEAAGRGRRPLDGPPEVVRPLSPTEMAPGQTVRSLATRLVPRARMGRGPILPLRATAQHPRGPLEMHTLEEAAETHSRRI